MPHRALRPKKGDSPKELKRPLTTKHLFPPSEDNEPQDSVASPSLQTQQDDDDFKFVYQLPIKAISGQELIPDNPSSMVRSSRSKYMTTSPQSAKGSTPMTKPRSRYAYQILAKRGEVEFINSVYSEQMRSPQLSFVPVSPSAQSEADRYATSPGHDDSFDTPLYMMDSPLRISRVGTTSSEKISTSKYAAQDNRFAMNKGGILEDLEDDDGNNPSHWIRRRGAGPGTVLMAEGIDYEDSVSSVLGSRPQTGSPGVKDAAHPSKHGALAHSDSWLKHIQQLGAHQKKSKPGLETCMQISSIAVPHQQHHLSSRHGPVSSAEMERGALTARISLPSVRRTNTTSGEFTQLQIISNPSSPVQPPSPSETPPPVDSNAVPSPTVTHPARPVQSFQTEKAIYDVYLDQLLGKGAFSALFVCQYRAVGVSSEVAADVQQAAIKVPEPGNPLASSSATRELLVLRDITARMRSQEQEDGGEEDAVRTRALRGKAFVTHLLDVFACNQQLHLVLPLYHGLNLRQFLDLDDHRHGVSEAVFLRIVEQLLSALSYLHEILRVVHADIKPENIVWKHPVAIENALSDVYASNTTSIPLHQAEIVLVDFGNAFFIAEADTLNRTPVDGESSNIPNEETRAVGYLQSRAYRAPEVIAEKYFGKCFLSDSVSRRASSLTMSSAWAGPSMDVWSAGCLFAELLTGNVLFSGESNIDQLLKIETMLGKHYPPRSVPDIPTVRIEIIDPDDIAGTENSSTIASTMEIVPEIAATPSVAKAVATAGVAVEGDGVAERDAPPRETVDTGSNEQDDDNFRTRSHFPAQPGNTKRGSGSDRTSGIVDHQDTHLEGIWQRYLKSSRCRVLCESSHAPNPTTPHECVASQECTQRHPGYQSASGQIIDATDGGGHQCGYPGGDSSNADPIHVQGADDRSATILMLLSSFLVQCNRLDHRTRWTAVELLSHPLLKANM